MRAAIDQANTTSGQDTINFASAVTNGGTMPCEVNIGTSQMEYLVTSGPDRIFSSRDCQAKSEDLVKVIAPGASETANFPWSRTRSVEGCQPIEAKPGGGGAYYIFTAKLGSKASPKAASGASSTKMATTTRSGP